MSYHLLVYRGTHVILPWLNVIVAFFRLCVWRVWIMQHYLNDWRGESWFLWHSLKRSAGYFRWEAGLHVFHSPAPYAFLTGPLYGHFGGRGWKVGSPLRPSASSLGESPGSRPSPVGLWDRPPFSVFSLCPLLSPACAFHCFGDGVWRDSALSVGDDCSGLLM